MPTDDPNRFIISLFIEEVKKEISVLKTNPPKEELLRIIHSVKSSLKLIGEGGYARPFAILEEKISEGDLQPRALKLAIQWLEEVLKETDQPFSNRAFLEEKADEIEKALLGKDKEIFKLFFSELDEMCQRMGRGLLELEKDPQNGEILNELTRLTHSLKGGARVVGLQTVSRLAHVLEECFITSKNGEITLDGTFIDLFLHVVDALEELVKNHSTEELEESTTSRFRELIEECEKALTLYKSTKGAVLPSDFFPKKAVQRMEDRTLKVTARYLDRLMGLAGGSIVNSRSLGPIEEEMTHLKKGQHEISALFDKFREKFEFDSPRHILENLLHDLTHRIYSWTLELNDRIGDLEMFHQRSEALSERLYQEIIEIRMRPFEDGTHGFLRLTRDLSKSLGKEVDLMIVGQETPVDREILERLESPLNHLIRNAIDHGIEMPEKRIAFGKSPIGKIYLKAAHKAGMLEVIVEDDGRGIDFELSRKEIEKRGLVNKEKLATLSDEDLLSYVVQPGFTTKAIVSEISGRGFGLDAVKEMLREVGGHLTLKSQKGQGLLVEMQLPLTLSIVRALIVEVGQEPYGFPLARIDRVTFVPKEEITVLENISFFTHQEKQIALHFLSDLLSLGVRKMAPPYCVVVISNETDPFGIIVDTFLGEKELVVQEMDPLLGKIQGILAGALLEDGSPVLILDVEDLLQKQEEVMDESLLFEETLPLEEIKGKRVLVVDDSVTVREVEGRLLKAKGYLVDMAMNGLEGWHAVRSNPYDLVITDLDMPRMDGIELIKKMREDPRFKKIPILVVTYKHRDEDKKQAMLAGANRFLTKSLFEEEGLLGAVEELLK